MVYRQNEYAAYRPNGNAIDDAHPQWERAIEAQIDIAKILQENKSRDKRFATQSKTDIRVSEPQASEETQRLAKLTELERQRRREAMSMLKIQ